MARYTESADGIHRKTVRVEVRLTRDEYRRIAKIAKRRHTTVKEYLATEIDVYNTIEIAEEMDEE